MKLIDILVQVLPKVGGWPMNCRQIHQVSNGWIYTVQGGYSVAKAVLADDWQNSVISEEDYNCALSESSNLSWSGEGVPPAGTVCEVFHGNSWAECEILYCGKYHVVVKIGNFEGAYDIGAAKFRTLTKSVVDVAENSFEDLARPLIKWINDNANPHAVILIDATSAVLYSGEKSITTEEFIKD